jgi:hypothetical protein
MTPVTDPATGVPDRPRTKTPGGLDRRLAVRLLSSRLVSSFDRANQAGIVTGLALLALLVLRNRDLLFNPVWEDGDFAADSILIDKARQFELLVGNYSRFGFNHPGPALLYVQAWSQLLWHDAIQVFASPFGAQFFGILALNSAICGLCATIVVRRTGQVQAAPVLVGCALTYTWLNPGLLVSTWMPNVYLCPFLLLLVSAASVATLELQDAWKFVLASGLLVHGHVSFILFTTGVAVVLIGALWFQRAAIAMGSVRRAAKQCVAIAVVFAFPIVINTLVNYPGEFPAYWRYSRSHQAGGHSVHAALAFVGDYWSSGHAGHVLALFLLIAAAVATRTFRGPARHFLMSVVGFVLLASVLTTVYAKFGIDDLSLRYIAIFYNAAPILTLFTITIAVIEMTGRSRLRYVVTAAIVLSLTFLASRPQLENPYRGAPWVPAAFDSVARLGPGPVRLDFALPFWPEAAGLVEESRRRNHDICVDPVVSIYATVFTNDLMCPIGSTKGATTVDIVAAPATQGRVIYTGPGFALTATRIAR